MTYRRTRIRRRRVAALLVVLAAAVAALAYRSPESMPSTPPITIGRSDDGHPREALGEAGGAIPAGTTVFDDDVPGVANLDADLLDAVRRAATDSGIAFAVDSGRRSAAYQEHLLEEAVAKYGSQAEAARWVATPDRSEHVSGNAIDLGPAAATAWLSAHGAAYGLCQIYANEPWHYELRPRAIRHGCPAVYADPTHDPRMHHD